MAQIIKPKRSTVAGKAPTTSDIEVGEIAVNLTDKKIYSRDAGGIIQLGGSSTITSSSVSDFSEAVDDRVATLLVAGTNITLTYNDGANTLTIASSGSGGGGGVTTGQILALATGAALS